MKHWIKRISLLLLLGVLLLSLCGCDDLDRMRSLQVFLEKDGSFYHEGTHYMPLNTNKYFNPVSVYTGDYYLTESDVPVLLSSEFAIGYLEFTKDGRFCRDVRRGLWFCDESIFTDIQAKNQKPFQPDTVFYEYYIYTGLGDYEKKLYILTPEEVAAIEAVRETEPLQLSDGMYIGYDWGLGLTAATEDLLFQRGGPSVFKTYNAYYLEIEEDYGVTTYQVPEAYNETFDHILKAYAETTFY